MPISDLTPGAASKRTEQAVNSNTVSLRKLPDCSLDWLNREDFLTCLRRQKDAELPAEYDV